MTDWLIALAGTALVIGGLFGFMAFDIARDAWRARKAVRKAMKR